METSVEFYIFDSFLWPNRASRRQTSSASFPITRPCPAGLLVVTQMCQTLRPATCSPSECLPHSLSRRPPFPWPPPVSSWDGVEHHFPRKAFQWTLPALPPQALSALYFAVIASSKYPIYSICSWMYLI